MTEFKGTKGKWNIDGIDVEKGNCAGNVRIQHPPIDIWYSKYHMVKNLQECHANALLISKAPEILEMLNESLVVIKWYMENTKPDNDDYDTFFNLGANQISSIEQLIK